MGTSESNAMATRGEGTGSGDEFVRMAFAFHEARPDSQRVQPILTALTGRYGETAHYAVLDGRSVVYRAKVDPVVGAMRQAFTMGGRNPAHATAVGKVLLADALPAFRQIVLGRSPTTLDPELESPCT